ncbi:type VII secretion target [Kitasatospora sp. NPDC050543]|uniref:type VII secretion target n=1 Tax=Kitasatospora sp. NPDC050543 TaxID=3364054 RepID=UPI0037AB1E5D
MADGMKVDPAALERAASGTTTSRGELKSAGAFALDETSTAASKLTGWRTAGGLGALRQRWEQQMNGVDGAMADLVERFHSSAGHYSATEGDVAARMHRSGRAFE